MRQVLYLGLDPARFECDDTLIHCPIIETAPRPKAQLKWALDDLDEYTHLIFSSQRGVRYFFDLAEEIKTPQLIAVGEATASAIRERGKTCLVAAKERQEGVIDLLRVQNLEQAYICVPCAEGARGILGNYLALRDVRHQIVPLYKTVPRACELPELSTIDELVFTSPSCVDAFFARLKPSGQHLRAIGPVTSERLQRYL